MSALGGRMWESERLSKKIEKGKKRASHIEAGMLGS